MIHLRPYQDHLHLSLPRSSKSKGSKVDHSTVQVQSIILLSVHRITTLLLDLTSKHPDQLRTHSRSPDLVLVHLHNHLTSHNRPITKIPTPQLKTGDHRDSTIRASKAGQMASMDMKVDPQSELCRHSYAQAREIKRVYFRGSSYINILIQPKREKKKKIENVKGWKKKKNVRKYEVVSRFRLCNSNPSWSLGIVYYGCWM